MITDNSRGKKLLALPIFLLFSFGLFYSNLHGPWYLDDFRAIVANQSIKDLGSTFLNFGPRWVANLSFALNYTLSAQDTFSYHLINIAIHGISSFAVFLLFSSLFRGRFVVPFLCGMVFLFHPVQSQPVNYIVQRATLLAALFFVASFYSFIKAIDFKFADKRIGFTALYVLSILFGMLAVLSKENTIVLPLLLILYLYLIDKRFDDLKKLALFVLPLICIPAAGVFAHLSVVSSTATGLSLVPFYLERPAESLYAEVFRPGDITLRYLSTESRVFWLYVVRALYPLNLVFDYCYPLVDKALNFKSVISGAAIAAALVLGYRSRHARPLFFFGLLWVLVTLAVESTLIPLDPAFEHRLYLPMVGFILIFFDLFVKAFSARAQVLLLSAVVVVLIPLCVQRNLVWADPVRLWEDNVRQVPRAPRSRMHLAEAYFVHGRYLDAAAVLGPLQRAPAEYLESMVLKGESLFFAGKTAEAMDLFANLQSRHPWEGSAEIYSGLLAQRLGDAVEAERLLRRAAEKSAQDYRPLYHLGKMMESRGDWMAAATSYTTLIRRAFDDGNFAALNYHFLQDAKRRRQYCLDNAASYLDGKRNELAAGPENPSLRGRFAVLLQEIGLYEESIKNYLIIAKSHQDKWQIYYNLGICFENLYDYHAAAGYYEKALELSPENILILNNIGAVYSKTGKLKEANQCYLKGIQLQTNDEKIWFNLAKNYFDLGDKAMARHYFEEVKIRFPHLERRAQLYIEAF